MTERGTANLVLVGFAMVALAGVLLRPAMPIDETRYLAVAWEMWLSGDWLVPTKNFAIYTHKPPLLFWAINAVWAVTGVSEVAARLVGPGFAVLAVVLTGRLARALWPADAQSGVRTVIALSGLLVFGIYGGATMFDAALAAATVGAMLALVHAVDTGRRRYWALLGVAIAAGVLAKGPVILIHVLPAMVLVRVWAGDRTGLSIGRISIGCGLALAVGAGVVALWLVPAILAGGPDYRDAILWTQSAGRMSDSFAHANPWWFYVALLPVLLFPWICMPGLVRAACAKRIWQESGLRLCGVWAGCALLLFSLISGKQAHYLVPEFAAAAIVVGRLARNVRIGAAFAVVPVLLLAIAGLALGADLLNLGAATDPLHPRALLVVWAVLTLAVCWLALRVGGLAGGAVLSLGMLLSVNLLIGLTDTASVYDTHRLAEIVAPGEAEGLAFFGQTYHAEFNFAGRLGTPVANPMTEAALVDWGEDHPDGLVIARPDRKAPDWPPRRTLSFRNAPYAVWSIADATKSEIGS